MSTDTREQIAELVLNQGYEDGKKLSNLIFDDDRQRMLRVADRILALRSPEERGEGERRPVDPDVIGRLRRLEERLKREASEAWMDGRPGDYQRFGDDGAAVHKALTALASPPVPVEGERFQMAFRFASRAHQGQRYTGYAGRPDEPYVLHPLRVADAVQPRCRVVAVLHDCMEDAGTLPDWLTETERAALDLLTRRKDRDEYAAYIARIRGDRSEAGEIAREVKIADLRDNLSHDPPDRLRVRYEAALSMLTVPVEGERERAIEDAARELDDYAGSIDELPRDAGVVRECASIVRALAAPSEPAKQAEQVGTSSDQVDARAALTRLYLAAHRAGVEAAAEVLSGTTKGWRTLVAARDTLAEDARADTEDEYNWTDPRSPLAQALAALPGRPGYEREIQERCSAIRSEAKIISGRLELREASEAPESEDVRLRRSAERICDEVDGIGDAIRGCALPVQGERGERTAGDALAPLIGAFPELPEPCARCGEALCDCETKDRDAVLAAALEWRERWADGASKGHSPERDAAYRAATDALLESLRPFSQPEGSKPNRRYRPEEASPEEREEFVRRSVAAELSLSGGGGRMDSEEWSEPKPAPHPEEGKRVGYPEAWPKALTLVNEMELLSHELGDFLDRGAVGDTKYEALDRLLIAVGTVRSFIQRHSPTPEEP